MKDKLEKIKRIVKDERGQTLSEYGLLIALVAVACLVVLGLLGKSLYEKFSNVQQEIEGASPY